VNECKPLVDERCYSIIVAEQSIYAEGGTYVDATPFLSSLKSTCGWSIGFWAGAYTRSLFSST
jgi:hypothetical protein